MNRNGVLFILTAFVRASNGLEAGVVKLGSMTILWKNWGRQTDFIVSISSESISSEHHWFSIGLNTKPSMNDANVIICKVMGNETRVEHHLTDGYVTRPVDVNNLTYGLSNARILKDQSGVMCSFTRDNLNIHPSYRIIFEGNEFFFIAAYGDLIRFKTHVFIQYHGYNRYISSPFYLSYPIRQLHARSKLENPQFKIGSFRTGIFSVEWIDTVQATDFNFTTRNVFNFKDFWTGFAFSTDIFMGEDDVNLCKLQDGIASLEHYYSPIQTTPSLMDPQQPTLGFSNIKTSYSNGILACSFRRVKNTSGNVFYYDLVNNDAFILTATGPIIGSNQKTIG